MLPMTRIKSPTEAPGRRRPATKNATARPVAASPAPSLHDDYQAMYAKEGRSPPLWTQTPSPDLRTVWHAARAQSATGRAASAAAQQLVTTQRQVGFSVDPNTVSSGPPTQLPKARSLLSKPSPPVSAPDEAVPRTITVKRRGRR